MMEGQDKPEKNGEGGCPVLLNSSSSGTGISKSQPWTWLGSITKSTAKAGEPSSPSCSASIEEAAKHAQTPQPDQRIKLDTSRQVSSIPRGERGDTVETTTPRVPLHQHGESETKWVYPSEQQLYNAMKKKGWSNIPEESVPVVLKIHNAVNEGTWQKICQWEGTDQLRLVRFEGRQQDLTPKAFLFSKVLGWNPMPFDRHDWYVGREGVSTNGSNQGTTPLQRYVIDYYMMDQVDPRLPPMTHIDVRPALDDFRAIYLHGQRFLQKALPGITAYVHRWQLEQHRQQHSQATPKKDEPNN